MEDLQELVKSATLKRELITSPVPVPAPSTSLHYHQTGSFWTHKQRIKSLPFNAQLYGWVQLWSFFFLSVSLCSFRYILSKWTFSVPRTNEIGTHTQSQRFHLLCISKAKQKKTQKTQRLWVAQSESFFFSSFAFNNNRISVKKWFCPTKRKETEKNALLCTVSKARLHALICLCSRHERARNATPV